MSRQLSVLVLAAMAVLVVHLLVGCEEQVDTETHVVEKEATVLEILTEELKHTVKFGLSSFEEDEAEKQMAVIAIDGKAENECYRWLITVTRTNGEELIVRSPQSTTVSPGDVVELSQVLTCDTATAITYIPDDPGGSECH